MNKKDKYLVKPINRRIMINDYPIMLYQVNFSGKGYDAKKN